MSTDATFANSLTDAKSVDHGGSPHSEYLMQVFKTSVPLVVMDVVAYLTSLLIASTIALCFGATAAAPSLLTLLVLIFGSLAMFAVLGLYSGMGMHPIYEFRQCMLAVCLSFVFIAGVTVQGGNALPILISFPIMLVTVPVIRSVTRHVLAKRSWWGVNCLVFACDKRVNTLFRNHLKNTPAGLRPAGFIQDDVPDSLSEDLQKYNLGTEKSVRQVMRQKNAFVALLHRRGRPDHEIAEYVKQNLSEFYRVTIVPDDERLPSLWAMGQNSGIMLEDKLLQPGSQIVKRTAGLLISATALVVGMPLFLVIAAWLKITSPGPLFYGHERIGKHGRRFKAWKFRSMCVNADKILEETLAKNPEQRAEWEATQKLQNDPRVSSAGRFLRKTSLDELPQLWNVLRGEMALVGPRPIVANEVEKYDDKFETYLRVTPGVTGFWQVSGRNLTSYEKRVELDDYYVRNWSLWFDLYILGRTIKTVLFREGAF